MIHDPSSVRLAIISILHSADRPMSSKEISDRLLGRFGIRVSNTSVGVNLGYLRIGEKAKRVRCFLGMMRFGQKMFPRMEWYWFSASHPNKYGWAFKVLMAHRYRDRWLPTLPMEKRRRKRPISDDMRQMIEDLAR